jgi:hypothetical protein
MQNSGEEKAPAKAGAFQISALPGLAGRAQKCGASPRLRSRSPRKYSDPQTSR